MWTISWGISTVSIFRSSNLLVGGLFAFWKWLGQNGLRVKRLWFLNLAFFGVALTPATMIEIPQSRNFVFHSLQRPGLQRSEARVEGPSSRCLVWGRCWDSNHSPMTVSRPPYLRHSSWPPFYKGSSYHQFLWFFWVVCPVNMFDSWFSTTLHCVWDPAKWITSYPSFTLFPTLCCCSLLSNSPCLGNFVS